MHPPPPTPGLIRRFGLWLLLFSLLAARKNAAAAAIAALLGLGSYFFPESFGRTFYLGWMRAVSPLGTAVSWAAAALVYFGVAFPLGAVLRLLGRDPLGLKRPPAGSCWSPLREAQDKSSLEKLY